MQNLFSEFKPVSAADWKTQVIKDLKGEAWENLEWHNENGFVIEPFYTSEDLKESYMPAFTHANWDICVKNKAQTAADVNKQLLRDLDNGASAISLVCGDLDLEEALNGIQLNYIRATFFVTEKNAQALKTYLEKNYQQDAVHAVVFIENTDLQSWKNIYNLFKAHKNISTISADVLHYHNQNGFAYYEVAMALSAIVDQLEYLSQHNEQPTKTIAIKTGVSADYFVQMAKLRALRRLWKLVKKEYNITNDLYVIAESSLTNKSVSDSYNNLLRTTVEAMAAVSGGCNELIVNEFDILFSSNKNLGERMAINQQLILKEESYLDKMADVACGSFYIEQLTDAIANKALETFKRFENEGGFAKCSEKNIFQSDLELQAQQKAELIASGKQVVIGVNKFRNEKEKIGLTATDIVNLEKLPVNNPALEFELQHYFQNA